MQALDDFIKRKIQEARRRITMVLLADYLLLGLTVGMGAAALIMVITLFVPVYYAPIFAAASVVSGLITGFVITLVNRPDMRRSALLLDSKGFSERVITAYERAGKEDAFSMLLKQDTKEKMTGFRAKNAFPMKPVARRLAVFCILAVILCVSGLIDSPARKQARQNHAIAMEAKKEAEKLKDALEKIEKQEELSAQEQEELKELFEEAKKEFKEAQSSEELEKAKERLAKKIEQEMKELLTEDKKDTARALLDMAMEMNPDLSEEEKKQISEALNELSELSEDVKDALEQAKKDGLESLSEEELAELSAKLAEAAAKLTDEELAAALSKAASAMSAEDLEAALAALSDAQGDMIAAALDGDGTMSLAGLGSGTGNGQGAGAGNGGSGQGTGTGSGTGAGDGSGGGWYNGGSQGSQSQETYQGDYVSVPENYQDNDNLTGTPTDGDSYIQEGGPSVTWDGIRMDYQKVIRDYQKRAYERMESGRYPTDYQDAIREYFENLNK